MREFEFHRMVSDEAIRIGGHRSAIESHISSPGIPDLNIFLEGVDVWVELKASHISKVKMRASQKAWHVKRARHGGKSWVIVATKTDILCVPGDVAATLGGHESVWRDAGTSWNMLQIGDLLRHLAKETRNAW
jgi:hypothetical protein